MSRQRKEGTMEDRRQLSLLRLRFPPDQEAAFATDYFDKILPWMRNGLLLLLALVALFWVRDYGTTGDAPAAVYVMPGGILLIMLLLTYHRAINSCWQPVVCLLGSAICLIAFRNEAMVNRAAAAGVDDWHLADTFLLYEFLALICGLVLSRLWFVWLTLFGWTIVLIGMAVAIQMLHIPQDLVYQRNAAILFPAMAVLMFSGYVQERSARGEFLANYLLAEERARAENLLRNILPSSVAERLKTTPGTMADSFAEVSVLFADLVDFTPLAAHMAAEETVKLLNAVFSVFDRLADRHGLEKIKTVGDAYMVVGGLPEPRDDHVAAIAELALEMQAEIAHVEVEGRDALQLRIGIHTGPVVAGVIGTRRFSYDLWGDTVNVASRMESQGEPGAIQVTAAVRDRLNTKYRFGPARTIGVKGRGTMEVYHLLGRQCDCT